MIPSALVVYQARYRPNTMHNLTFGVSPVFYIIEYIFYAVFINILLYQSKQLIYNYDQGLFISTQSF